MGQPCEYVAGSSDSLLADSQSSANLVFLARASSLSLSLIASRASLVIHGSLASGTLNVLRGHIWLITLRMDFLRDSQRVLGSVTV